MFSSVHDDCECLLVHAGMLIVADGLPSLFHHLNNAGVNAGLLRVSERQDDDLLRVMGRLKRLRLIGFSMHWHPQIAISLKLAELFKTLPTTRAVPNVFGGITASVFADELLRFPHVDYVVRGDGEEPLRQLYGHLVRGEPAHREEIPNLWFREDGEVRRSDARYHIDNDTLTALERPTLRNKELFAQTNHVISAGRGCAHHCIHCGGSREAYAIWGDGAPQLKRRGEDIRAALDEILEGGGRMVNFQVDRDARLARLAEHLQGYDLSRFDGVSICAWGLPTLQNVETLFQSTPLARGPFFRLEISPEAGTNEARHKARPHAFTNAELEAFMQGFFTRFPGKEISLFFSYVFPLTQKEDRETRSYIRHLTDRFLEASRKGLLRIYYDHLSTDPGSAIQRGEVEGVTPQVSSLRDYHTQMLATPVSWGDFLRHSLSDMAPGETDYYTHLFRLENTTRDASKSLYLNLIALFDSFDEYDEFLQRCFDRLYPHFIRPSAESIPVSRMLLSGPGSLFGFNWGYCREDGMIGILWFRFIRERLLEEADRLKERHGEKRRRCTFGGQRRELRFDQAFDYVLELLHNQFATMAFQFSAANNHRPLYQHVLDANELKISALRGAAGSSSPLVPTRSNLCELHHLRLAYAMPSDLSHRDHLRLLGRPTFEQLLRGLDTQRIRASCLTHFRRPLLVKKEQIQALAAGPEEQWERVTQGNDPQHMELLSRLIVLGHVPLDRISARLKELREARPPVEAGEAAGARRGPELAPAPLPHLSTLYGQFSDQCDIRLVAFYLGYLRCLRRQQEPLIPGKEGLHIYRHLYLPQADVYDNPLFLCDRLSVVERSVLSLCDGANPVERIIARTTREHADSGVTDATVTDILVYFYARQMIY